MILTCPGLFVNRFLLLIYVDVWLHLRHNTGRGYGNNLPPRTVIEWVTYHEQRN